MRMCRALARDALAAPSRLFRPFNERIIQAGKGLRLTSRLRRAKSLPRPSVDAKYSTALVRLRQHLFFARERHARPKEAPRRVVSRDREHPAAPVEQEDVPAVFPRAPARGGAPRWGPAEQTPRARPSHVPSPWRRDHAPASSAATSNALTVTRTARRSTSSPRRASS